MRFRSPPDHCAHAARRFANRATQWEAPWTFWKLGNLVPAPDPAHIAPSAAFDRWPGSRGR